ncbi:MAG TPA: EthD family reductase [Eoetvoesiella sp.]
MVKRISLLTRKEGMSKEEFLKHWNDHLPISHDVPGLRRYVLSHIMSEPQRLDVPVQWELGQVDGIAETWFDSQEATDEAFSSPEGKRWLAHGATFIGRQKTFVVEEEVVIAGSGYPGLV